jgi:hypothetical protein
LTHSDLILKDTKNLHNDTLSEHSHNLSTITILQLYVLHSLLTWDFYAFSFLLPPLFPLLPYCPSVPTSSLYLNSLAGKVRKWEQRGNRVAKGRVAARERKMCRSPKLRDLGKIRRGEGEGR